jgi:hypothetical protein
MTTTVEPSKVKLSRAQNLALKQAKRQENKLAKEKVFEKKKTAHQSLRANLKKTREAIMTNLNSPRKHIYCFKPFDSGGTSSFLVCRHLLDDGKCCRAGSFECQYSTDHDAVLVEYVEHDVQIQRHIYGNEKDVPEDAVIPSIVEARSRDPIAAISGEIARRFA